MSANLLAMLPQNETDSEVHCPSLIRLNINLESEHCQTVTRERVAESPAEEVWFFLVTQEHSMFSESSIRDMAYNIAHAIQFTSKFIEDREKRRNNPVIKIVSLNVSLYLYAQR